MLLLDYSRDICFQVTLLVGAFQTFSRTSHHLYGCDCFARVFHLPPLFSSPKSVPIPNSSENGGNNPERNDNEPSQPEDAVGRSSEPQQEDSAAFGENSGAEEKNEISFSDLVMKRSSSLKGRRRSFKLPAIFAYPARNRPRQPFMNQGQRPNPERNRTPASVPPPPSYYSSQVTPEAHNPEALINQRRRRSDGSSSSRSPAGSPTRQAQPQETNRDTIRPAYLNPLMPGPITVLTGPVGFQAIWVSYPERIPANVPPCLAHLVAADALFIIQQLDIIELYLNVSEPNFYLIQNKHGHCIYYVYETPILQLCCHSKRGFQLHVHDVYHNEIIYMNTLCGCYDCFCCYPVMEVYSPPLVPVGAIVKTCHKTHDEFSILDADENKMFKIHGPCCVRTCGCFAEVEFTIHALDSEETEIGMIRREWGGYVRFLTNEDLYGISFPVDLDVRVKAVFLGALFLIEYTLFE